MSTVPRIKPHSHTIVICTGKDCAKKKQIKQLDKQLKMHISRFNRQHKPRRITRIKTPCLGICEGGPLLVVYPGGVWYHHVDEAALERIFRQHLTAGQPVAEHLFFHMADYSDRVEQHGLDDQSAQPAHLRDEQDV